MQVADSSTTMPANLSPAQAQVIAALAQGRTVTAAAQEAGLHRNTIYNWYYEPAFKTAVEEAQSPSSPPLAAVGAPARERLIRPILHKEAPRD